MKESEVPQDNLEYYGDRRRACYARDEDGRYKIVPSTGWNTEAIVNGQAVAEMDQFVEQARASVRRGEYSPLYFHMASRQMTVALLAAHVGIARWRVRRHLRHSIFRNLRPKMIARYCEILGLLPEELQTV